MVWYFIGVYIINRTLHGALGDTKFLFKFWKKLIFHLFAALTRFGKYFSTLKEKFRISTRPCNILYISIYIPFTSPSCKSKNEKINRNMLPHTYTIVKKSCCDRHTLGGSTVLKIVNDQVLMIYYTKQCSEFLSIKRVPIKSVFILEICYMYEIWMA